MFEQMLKMFGGVKGLLKMALPAIGGESGLNTTIKQIAESNLVDGKVYTFHLKLQNGTIWLNHDNKTMTSEEVLTLLLGMLEQKELESKEVE